MDLTEIADPAEQYEAMARVAQTAESAGFDSVWLYDHFHTIPEPTLESTFECWSTTAALARDTRRVKIGQMVTCFGYRYPSVLAKMASTVDTSSDFCATIVDSFAGASAGGAAPWTQTTFPRCPATSTVWICPAAFCASCPV